MSGVGVRELVICDSWPGRARPMIGANIGRLLREIARVPFQTQIRAI